MAKWEVTNKIEYPTDNVALFSQKTRDELELVYNLLNRLRNLDASNGTPTDIEPYQLHIDTATKKLQIRNAENTSWIELGKIDENYFGLTPENISAVKNTGTIGAIYSGNDSAKSTSNLKVYDLYFAFNSKKLYYWTGTTWQLFLSLNFENLLNYADHCVLKSEVDYSGKNKVLRLDAVTGFANVSITGSAAQVDGKDFSISNAQDNEIIIYDGTAESFVNKPKSSALNEYVLKTGLEPYAKKSDVANSLSAYTNTINLNAKLENYVLTTELISNLAGYAKTSTVTEKVANLNSAVGDSLSSYEKTSAVNTKIMNLGSAVVVSLDAYTKTADLNNQLKNYALRTDVENTLQDYETVADFNAAIVNYVTNSNLETSLQSYSTTAEINSSLESYVSEDELTATLADYSTTAEIKSSLAAYPTTSEVAVSLSSYVTNESLASSLENYVSESEIATSLNGVAKISDLAPYAKKNDVATSLTLYAKTTDLQAATVAGAAKANKIAKPFTLNVTGGAIGSAMIDGSSDVILSLNVNRAASANSADSALTALNASSANTAVTATRAEQDSAGNNIASTYVTKSELNNFAAKIPALTFALTGNILTISDGTNSYKFIGTAV